MLTLLQASCPAAVPVALGAVLAPHSNATFGGTVIVGLEVSRRVMVWMRLVELPHASVAVHTREMTLAPLPNKRPVRDLVTEIAPPAERFVEG